MRLKKYLTPTAMRKSTFRYPSMGDPLPPKDKEVLLIKASGRHERGVWTDDCRAWADCLKEKRT